MHKAIIQIQQFKLQKTTILIFSNSIFFFNYENTNWKKNQNGWRNDIHIYYQEFLIGWKRNQSTGATSLQTAAIGETKP